MSTYFKVSSYEDFLALAKQKDIRIAKATIDAILENLNTKRKNIHVFEIEVEDEGVTYDLTIERENFLDALEKNLEHYEREELYEECVEIVNAITFLKNKQ